MRPPSREQAAWTLHETFLEVLRRLNQAAEEGYDLDGLEYKEIERATAKFWSTRSGGFELHRAIELLVENGLVGTLEDPAYSWLRNRTVGTRYLITSLGKSYLVRQIENSGRIR